MILTDTSNLKNIRDFEWEILKAGDMLVPGRIFGNLALVEDMDEQVKVQVTNVACLPGIVGASVAMPDAHWGYGFPIGGVAALDPEGDGVITMGGIGFDGGCGVRSLMTNLKTTEITRNTEEIMKALFDTVPAGLGSRGEITVSKSDLFEALCTGAKWAVKKGYGNEEDLEHIEDGGSLKGAEPLNVSEVALKREQRQIGTLGSGNHYLELQYVDQIFDETTTKSWGIEKGQVFVSIHCGSRALGHQVASDYLKTLDEASRHYRIGIKDRELVCAPINSLEGKRFLGAINCVMNYSYANRQVLTHLVRKCFKEVLPDSEVRTFWDQSHNSIRFEEHEVDGKSKKLLIHRKGSTRAFGPARKEIPQKFRETGQPVLIGGTMGTSSYILKGTEHGLSRAFGSACHGAGRAMSRTQAKKRWRGQEIVKKLKEEGILVLCHSWEGLAEEAPGAYKDVSIVVDSVHDAGLAKKVIGLRPLGCIKG